MNAEDTMVLTQRIIAQGLEGAQETQLLDDLVQRLTAAGVPLMRVNISLPTLHPVIGGHLFIWHRDRGAAIEEDWARNVAGHNRTYARSPFEHMFEADLPCFRRRLAESETPSEFPMLDRFRAEGATDYFIQRTVFGAAQQLGPVDRILMSWLTDAPNGFDDTHLAIIEELAPAIALAVKAAATYRIAHTVIETYLGQDAGRQVLGGAIELGAGETIRAALWSCDLQGFTKLADALPRDQLLALMHEYFACMVSTLEEHGGQVLKFMGDGLLAIFNKDEDGASCRAALAAADRVLARVAEVSARRQAAGLPGTKFYLGLHLGDVLYGNIGAKSRLDFTVVGPAVNEVSRIEVMCRALDQTLIASSAFAAAADDPEGRLVSLGRYVLRGVRSPQELFTLVSDAG